MLGALLKKAPPPQTQHASAAFFPIYIIFSRPGSEQSCSDKSSHLIEFCKIQFGSSVHTLGRALGIVEGCEDGIELAKSVGFELGDSLITDGEVDIEGSKVGVADGIVDGAIGVSLDPPHTQHASPALFPKL